ncbi:hypothetical protein PIB30_058950 [Stylosanthes scabra]|uniref:HMG box domain-containing protein n=1 Tax=Stylosanthes scabra TaxID=79078 RepID=A0ABU6ZIW0_9FABA|nr:hypothetical protein [Stylosanthes scabra]
MVLLMLPIALEGQVLKLTRIQNLPLLKDKEEQDKKDTKKMPSAPYVLWCKDQWNEIKKTNPEAEFKEISNMLGAKWKTVSTEEKKPYEDKYNAEKEAYMEGHHGDTSATFFCGDVDDKARKLVQEIRDIAAMEGVKRKHFFLEADIKGPSLKLNNTRKAILTITLEQLMKI